MSVRLGDRVGSERDGRFLQPTDPLMKSKFIATIALALVAASAASALQQSPAAPRSASKEPGVQRFYVTIPSISLEAASYVATEIVHARVENVRTVFPTQGVAHTIYTVRVLSAMKGDASSTIDVTVAGAESETQRVEVEGAPHFAFDEEVVLFLWTSPSSRETGILGLERGTYRVSRDDEGKRFVHGEHADGAELNSFFDDVGNAWLRAETRIGARKDK